MGQTVVISDWSQMQHSQLLNTDGESSKPAPCVTVAVSGRAVSGSRQSLSCAEKVA